MKIVALLVASLTFAGVATSASADTPTPAIVPNARAVSTLPRIANSVPLREALARKAAGKMTAQDDTIYGPYWVQFDAGHCDIAKLYLQGNQLFGTEVGCSDTLNQTYAGTVDYASESVYISVPGTGTAMAGVWNINLVSDVAQMALTQLDSSNNLVPTVEGPYGAIISLSQPAGAAY